MNRNVTTLSTDALRRLIDFTSGPLAAHYAGLRSEALAELEARATDAAAPAPAHRADPAPELEDDGLPPAVVLDIPDPHTPQPVPDGTRYGTTRGNLRAIV